MKLYIAYGSNLNKAQMAYRCPTAKVFGTGILKNWELLYRGTRKAGVTTIRRKAGSCVPVGIWVIDEKSERNLDVYEGYPHLYKKQNVYVTLSDGSKRLAMVYIMHGYKDPHYPSEYYESTIRQGYMDFNLNIDFFEQSLLNCYNEIS